MKTIEIEIFNPSDKLPKNGDVVLVWTTLLSAERCKFLNGQFHIGNDERWVEEHPLAGVKYWSELPRIPELEW
jgi:hypothetical protein